MSRTLATQAGPIEELDMAFPRPITSLHQIELTSRCNLRCSYCPSPHLGRPKEDMPHEVFLRCLEWASYYVLRGTQSEVNLAGIGESTLHPRFIEYVHRTREAVGSTCRIVMATNGLGVTEELVKEIAPARPHVTVSLHRPEKALLAVNLYNKYGILEGVSADPSLRPNSWAGQIAHLIPLETKQAFPCPWMRGGWVFALSDGRISRCCLDADGSGVIGDVMDPIGSVQTSPWKMCSACYQVIGVKGWDQEKGCAA